MQGNIAYMLNKYMFAIECPHAYSRLTSSPKTKTLKVETSAGQYC